jgi:copper chaperone CopZ
MKSMRSRVTPVMRALLVFLLACDAGDTTTPIGGALAEQPKTAARQPVAPPRPAALTQVTIKALGMYCEESCPMKVRYALADVPQVYELGFDVSTESIFISFDSKLGPADKATKPMVAAIKTAGFDPWLAKQSWPADAKVQVVHR